MNEITTKINEITTALDTNLDNIENDIGKRMTMPNGGANGNILVKNDKSLTGTDWGKKPDVVTPDCFCLEAMQDNQTVQLYGTPTVASTQLEYSRDLINWTTYNWNDVLTLAKTGDKIYMRGDNTSMQGLKFSQSQASYINASGNIMTLLDKSGQSLEITAKQCFDNFFRNCINWTFRGLKLPATKLAEQAYYWMFGGSGIEEITLPDATYTNRLAYQLMFQSCSKLKKVVLLYTDNVTYPPCYETFTGCSALEYLEVHFTTWNNSYWINDNTNNYVKFVCPSALDTTIMDNNHVKSSWTIINGCNEGNNETTSTNTVSESQTFIVNAGNDVATIAVASALTLYANKVDTGKIAYAEVVIDLATGASVTADSSITIVDTLESGKRNICIVRWQDGAAKLYVSATEDLDESESSSSI